MVQLYPHNQKLYDEMIAELALNQSVIISEATGCGKSFVIAKYIEQTINRGEKILYISPVIKLMDYFHDILATNIEGFSQNDLQTVSYQFINEQIKAINSLNDGSEKEDYENIYGYISNNPNSIYHINNDNEIEINNYALVIVDEMHHIGAPKWGAAVKQIMNDLPIGCKVIGLSATPNRFVNGVDNIINVFDGRIVEGPNVHEAIQQGILPKPYYIHAMYKMYATIEKSGKNKGQGVEYESILLDKRWTNVMSEDERNGLINKIKLAKVRQMENLNTIFLENITKHAKDTKGNNYRILVFHTDKFQLERNRGVIDPIMKQISKDTGKTLNSAIIHSSIPREEQNQVLDRFVNGDGIQILHSINMFIEGYHLGVNCVIMMRTTESYNVYLQQLGRALEVGFSSEPPLIMDMVSNYALVNKISAETVTQTPSAKVNRGRYNGIIPEVDATFIPVKDDAMELLGDVQKRLDSYVAYRNTRIQELAYLLNISKKQITNELKNTNGDIDQAVDIVCHRKWNIDVEYEGETLPISTVLERNPELTNASFDVIAQIIKGMKCDIKTACEIANLRFNQYEVENPDTGEKYSGTPAEIINATNAHISEGEALVCLQRGASMQNIIYTPPTPMVTFNNETLPLYDMVVKYTDDQKEISRLVLGYFEGMDVAKELEKIKKAA